mmetsp:Transcript_11950/g.22377  ORF Transcript_11950/g.22377 Transcript_11950/m.22377 type:complete len:1017 (-) Transcript_11950:370-3420(-)
MDKYNRKNNIGQQRGSQSYTCATLKIVKAALILIPNGAQAWTNAIHTVVNPLRYHGSFKLIPSPTYTYSSSSSKSSIFLSQKDSIWYTHGDHVEGISPSNILLSLKNDAKGNGGMDSGNAYSALEKAVLSSSSNDAKMPARGGSGGTRSGGASVEDVRSALDTGLVQVKETLQVLQDMQHSAYLTLVGNILEGLKTLDGFTSFVFSTFVALPLITAQQYASQVSNLVQDFLSSVDATLLQDPTVGPTLLSVQTKVGQLLSSSNMMSSEQDVLLLPPTLGIFLSATTTYVILSTIFSIGKGPPPSSPYPLGRYDPKSARAYFDQRPLSILQRGLEIASLSVGFGLKLLQDKMKNQLEENQDQRALELAELLTKLGPTFIKIGQSLSIRTDLLSPAYVRGLTSLQDQVPAFSTKIAREIIEEELGQPVDYFFSEFSAEPVAAASLGQVFRGRLKLDGREVAIKVQRPDIMNQIALDMHLLREIAPIFKRTFNLNSDTVGTVDAWGIGFVDELNYISEAENADYFTESIQNTPLRGVVFAPSVVDECTTEKVLTTEWVIGERLDKSSSEDITTLCSIAMNTYLTMMLETGVLHCDPHPGNLLRTPEGKLCILDWGMVTRLDPDLQVTLIEHMAHLTSADYAEVPRDLLLLGFIPESKADLIRDSGIVEVLANVYGQWTSGGGVNGINVNEVVASLQDLTVKKGNLFQIPPYFAYIAKSFSVLEGIGLSNNPKYSIINECLPYVSKRLLTDESERTGGALSTFIFGPKKNDANRIIDYKRVEQLISGFGDYSISTAGPSLTSEKSQVELIDNIADQVLELLAAEEETPLQAIFIEQIAKIISASSRSLWSELRERSGKLPSGRSVVGTLVDPLGLFRSSPVIRMNSLDKETLESTRNLINLLGKEASKRGSPMFDVSKFTASEIQQLTSKLVQKVWARRNGIFKTGNRLATKLLQLTADKLESGERETLTIPASDMIPETNAKKLKDTKVAQNSRSSNQTERIATANMILKEAELNEAFN